LVSVFASIAFTRAAFSLSIASAARSHRPQRIAPAIPSRTSPSSPQS
jgi:hypothetical protein